MRECDNLIFHRRAAVDELTERLLDLDCSIGQPKKITMIFGRKVTKEYKGKLQTVIEDLDLPNPVIRSHYGHGVAKQYVRDDRILRTEPATNNVYDSGVNKDVENLPRLRERVAEIIDNYHNVQQDILETFCRSRPTAKTGRAYHPSKWKADPRPQTRSPATTGSDAFPCALRQHCRRRPVYLGRFWSNRSAASLIAYINASATIWRRF